MGTIEDIIKEKNLTKMDMAELEALVQSILKDNKHIVAQYTGKENMLYALAGIVMKEAEDRADAKDIIRILKDKINTIKK